VIVLTNSEDYLLNNKERGNTQRELLLSEENAYDQNFNDQIPEFDALGTALNEL
jgi:hypothetical protein